MGLRPRHKKAKSGLPPSPNHEVSFALSGMGETHSSPTQASASWEDAATWLMPRLGQGLVWGRWVSSVTGSESSQDHSGGL